MSYNHLRSLLVVFLLLTTITGLAYPLLVAGLGTVLFPAKAAGSLVYRDGTLVGSSLISQSFADPKFFWGRLSATAPMPNNAAASGGSNFGPLNPARFEAAKARIEALRAADPANQLEIPIDLVTASASGLDPDISPAAALYQVDRVAAARHIDARQLRARVLAAVRPAQWGFLGEPRVNVLELNLSLDPQR